MGYRLRREVRDALPPGLLTAAERLLVLELADVCNDDTREGWPGAAQLAKLTDLSERSIQETLSRIGKKWLELRVPLGKSETGKVYYSYAGKRTTFRFPALGSAEGATDRGSYGATDPGASTGEGATDPGGRCDGSVQKVRQIRGPSPQGTSLKINTSPPPTPSADLAVIDAEIVEEGEATTSSLEHQIQELVDEIRMIRPSWPAAELRTHITGAMGMFGESFSAVAELARRTARDPTSARPSRITASGNPHVEAMSTAYLVAKADATVTAALPTHPDAHPFEPGGSGSTCLRCPLPEANERHRVPTSSRSRYRNEHRPYLNPAPEDFHRVYDPSKL